MRLLLVAVSALTAACATAAPVAPAPVAPAQAQTAHAGFSIYSGTYALQAPSRVLTARIWVDAGGTLNGELVELGQRATFRPADAEHRFLHAESDQAWLQFTVENGRATRLTMHQRGREISGPRTQ